MSGFFSSRRLLAGVLVLSVSATATGLFGQNRGPATATATAPATAAAAAQPTVPVDPNAPIAVIAGMPINNQAFYNILMEVAGMRVFQQVFDLVLVQHAMKLSGIPFDGEAWQKKVAEESELTIQAVVDPTDPKKKLTLDEKRAILGAALQRQGMTNKEFMIKMETQAGLRALSAGKNDATAEEARMAYDAEWGPQRKVHLMFVSDANMASQVTDAIKKGKIPEETVADIKYPQPPISLTISKNAQGLGDVHKVIFETLTRAKELSSMVALPAAEGQKPTLVMVQLDEIVPDRTKDTGNAYNETEYKNKVKSAKEQQWMSNHLQTLRGDPAVLAQTEIKDPYLKAQFEAVAANLKAQYEAQTRAATQPTSGPGAIPASAPAPAPAATGRGRG